MKAEMGADELEDWRAHFRLRKEWNPEEWVPITDRIKTIEELRQQAEDTADRLDRWGK